MKVINSLIAVEVPRGADWGIMNDILMQVNGTTELLPFPAEIIGLASEIDLLGKLTVVNTAAPNITSINKDSFRFFMQLHSIITTPTTDIIFLRKKL